MEDLRGQVPADAELLAELKREYAEAPCGEHAARELVEATDQVCSTATRGNVPVRLLIE